MRYKNSANKFWIGLLITILVIGALVGICFILDALVPAVHNAFVTAIDWVKNLFTQSENAVEKTTEVVNSCFRR